MLARYGIYRDACVSILAFVPVEYRQTHNTAKLLAVYRVVEIFTTGEVAICTESQYVILGPSKAAVHCKIRGEGGSSGPVSNVPPWEPVLAELGRPGRAVNVVRVLSHVTVEGYNEGDRVAEQGRHMHPRYPRPHTPLSNCIHGQRLRAPNTGGFLHPTSHRSRRQLLFSLDAPHIQLALSEGMPCTHCAHSAKFWRSANTRTLLLAPFDKLFVAYRGLFNFLCIWHVAHLNCHPLSPFLPIFHPPY